MLKTYYIIFPQAPYRADQDHHTLSQPSQKHRAIFTSSIVHKFCIQAIYPEKRKGKGLGLGRGRLNSLSLIYYVTFWY
jgi:hypothetical protein